MKTITLDIDANGTATLTIDVPGQSMNVVNADFIKDLTACVARIKGEDAIQSVILISGKKAGFMAGADLRMLAGMGELAKTGSLEDMFNAANGFSALLRDLETCGKPIVACVHGMALGGGFELALAAHHRILGEGAQLGLPEVMVGLLPGAGGIQRLMRLAGIQLTLQYATTGKNLKAVEAMGLGIAGAIVPVDQMLEAAKAYLADKPAKAQPWDAKGFKIPGGGGAMNPNSVRTFMGACGMAQDKSLHLYPAVEAILSCAYEGSIVPFDTAIRLDVKRFAKLIIDGQALNMIRTLFINKTSAEKGEQRPKDIAKHECKKLGMLGAGMMGAGIAYVSALAGMDVVLLDMSEAGADRGKAYSVGLLEKSVKRGKMTKEQADAILARITPTTDFAALEGCDLIIEAVFEEMGIKADVTKKTEAVIPKDTIFASNTSTLPITGLAQAFSRPEDFIGIHFFSPVDKMPLVEIIMGKKTGDKALAVALDYVAKIKKTPIVVNDSRGFYTSRCFGTYVTEGVTMLAEGVNPALIENAGRMCGMPVGPLAVADEVSIELSYKVMMATKAAMGDAYQASAADDVFTLFVEKLGRMGRKSGGGYYDYPEGGKKHLWTGLAEHFPVAKNQPTLDEVKTRLLYRQTIEAARCFEEGVLRDPQSGDLGAIFGWGFAPWTGGPLSFVDSVGAEAFVAEANRLAQEYGARFHVPKLLKDMAQKKSTFYKAA